jgi:hypothetical protein
MGNGTTKGGGVQSLRCSGQRDAKAKAVAVAMAKGKPPGNQRLCCAPDNRWPCCHGCLFGRRVLASAGEAAGGSAPAASSVPMADGHQRRALACAWAEYRNGGCSGVQLPSCRVDLSAAATCRTRRHPLTRAAQPFLACARSKAGVAH